MAMYETLFIAQPGLAEPEAETLCQTFEQVVRDGQGTFVKSDRWGKRKLAYPVRKHQEGFFYLFQFEAPTGVVTELERRLRNNEQVLKYLSVRLDRRAVEALAAAEKKAAEKTAARAAREAERAAREGSGFDDRPGRPSRGDDDAEPGDGDEE